jgi:hypothetical protein
MMNEPSGRASSSSRTRASRRWVKALPNNSWASPRRRHRVTQRQMPYGREQTIRRPGRQAQRFVQARGKALPEHPVQVTGQAADHPRIAIEVTAAARPFRKNARSTSRGAPTRIVEWERNVIHHIRAFGVDSVALVVIGCPAAVDASGRPRKRPFFCGGCPTIPLNSIGRSDGATRTAPAGGSSRFQRSRSVSPATNLSGALRAIGCG